MSFATADPIALATPRAAPILVAVADEFAPPTALEAAWMADLPAARQARLAAWPDAAARHRSLIGSRLLGHCLRARGWGAGALATLHHPAAGKPTLSLPVDFSLSHGGGRVLCALSTAGPVGVDVEAIEDLRADEFGHYLSDDERRWAGSDAGRFAALWTRKEAVAKAAGLGLRALPRVATQADASTATLDGHAWQTCPLPLGPGHAGHLAWPVAQGALAWQLCSVTRDQLEAG